MEQPDQIGKYSVIDVAGRGAMGTVYVGHDPFIDRKVAIKVCIAPEDNESDSARSKRIFFNEAQSAGSLDHPHILKVYDAGEADGQPYIVMEYVEGGATLKPHCARDNRLPIGRVVDIIIQCAKALDYAHRRGVTHRDIKPANIMLTPEGDAKIGDFGIAQRVQSDTTQLLGGYGSPLYMSPEQTRDEPLTHHTDIYSLGVTLYELLSGKPPFMANQLTALILAITTQDAPRLTSMRDDVSEAFADVIARTMAKDPAARQQSGAELAAELAAAYEGMTRQQHEELSDEQKLSAARELAFFAGFSDSELEEVTLVGHWEWHVQGTRVFEDGDAGDGFFVIVSGEVSVRVGNKIVATLGKGECFGEMGYLSAAKRAASVDTLSDVLVVKLEEPLMDWATIGVQLRFSKAFQQTLISRLRTTTVELARLMR